MESKNGFFIQKRSMKAALGIAGILLYWMVYFWQDTLSNQGNYRWFSYSFHEVYSIGYLLVPLVTAIWLFVLCISSLKDKAWRKNRILLFLLTLLFLLQAGYWQQRSQIVSIDAWTDVIEIPDEYHIVILDGEDQKVTLETIPIVTTLLRTNGTIYGFSYESKKSNPSEGVLHFIWDTIEIE